MQKGVYMVYIIKRPFLCDLENVPETINNNRCHILQLFFSLHDNLFSCAVPSVLCISPQSCCMLFKDRKKSMFLAGSVLVFAPIGIEQGFGQDKYFHRYVVFIVSLYINK